MAFAKMEVRLLLSTMRSIGSDSALGRSLLGLEAEQRLTLVTVFAQESQREVARKVFPSAEFCVRGLGDWPHAGNVSFPARVTELYSKITSLVGFSEFKTNVIASLNRHDSSGTFRLVDRELYFHRSLLELLSVIDRNQPTHLFFDITPHVSRDYMLFWVAKAIGLKVLFLQPVPWAGIALPKSELFGSIPPNPLVWKERGGEGNSGFYEFSLEQGRNLITNLTDAKASWVARYQVPEIKKLSSRTVSVSKIFFSVREKMKGQNSLSFSGFNRLSRVERLLAVSLEWRLRRDFLKKRLEINSTRVDRSGEFVLFALTHEPERTFFPEALPHDSQFEVALQIAAQIKRGQKLLVKEHETQFVPGRRGYAARSVHFYETLSSVENIEVVPSSTSAKSLIEGSVAVVSATGTIGVEAALRGKPSYYFGNPWWAGFPGTAKVDHFATMSFESKDPPTDSSIEEWLTHFLVRCIPTTSNVEASVFSRKFAPLPLHFRDIEETSLRITLEDFISGRPLHQDS